jgi:hypothetical protein
MTIASTSAGIAVEQPRNHLVNPAAVVTDEQAETCTKQHAQNRRDQRQGDDFARPVDDAAEYVASEMIGAKGMQRRRRFPRCAANNLIKVVGRNHGTEDSDDEEKDDDHRPQQRQRATRDAAQQHTERKRRARRRGRRRTWGGVECGHNSEKS